VNRNAGVAKLAKIMPPSYLAVFLWRYSRQTKSVVGASVQGHLFNRGLSLASAQGKGHSHVLLLNRQTNHSRVLASCSKYSRKRSTSDRKTCLYHRYDDDVANEDESTEVDSDGDKVMRPAKTDRDTARRLACHGYCFGLDWDGADDMSINAYNHGKPALIVNTGSFDELDVGNWTRFVKCVLFRTLRLLDL